MCVPTIPVSPRACLAGQHRPHVPVLSAVVCEPVCGQRECGCQGCTCAAAAGQHLRPLHLRAVLQRLPVREFQGELRSELSAPTKNNKNLQGGANIALEGCRLISMTKLA